MTRAYRPADTSLPLIEATVGDTLRATAAQFPDRAALAWEQGEGIATLTYAQLLAEAEQVAGWLLRHGVPGDRVAIWSRNCVEWVIAEYGCALAGLVIASWNPAWTYAECSHARDLTTPVLVLAGYDTRGTSLIGQAGKLAGEAQVHPLEALRVLAADGIASDLPAVSPDDSFLIQFTSGTTGRIKGAEIGHRAAINAAWLRCAATGADETDIWVNPAPLNHVGGAITVLLGAMAVGGCYVVMPRFDPGEMLRLIRACGGTRIGGVPTMLYALLDHPDRALAPIALRGIGVGGAIVPIALVERLTVAFGAPVLVAFGQSESPIVSSGLPDDPFQRVVTTAGRVSPHVALKIADAEGRVLALGEVGRICVAGPCVMKGYFAMPQATAAVFDAEGFLDTGDLGSLDAEGYLRIEGRARDVVIRGGENIYPAEVEQVLLTHPAVAAIAVVGVPDERWGQQLAAAVELRAGATCANEALEAYAAIRLAYFKVPRRWLFVDRLPLTASGKVQKVTVEGWFDGAMDAI